jgi:hypothetical protein
LKPTSGSPVGTIFLGLISSGLVGGFLAFEIVFRALQSRFLRSFNLSDLGIMDDDLNDAEPQGLHFLANQFEPVTG